MTASVSRGHSFLDSPRRAAPQENTRRPALKRPRQAIHQVCHQAMPAVGLNSIVPCRTAPAACSKFRPRPMRPRLQARSLVLPRQRQLRLLRRLILLLPARRQLRLPHPCPPHHRLAWARRREARAPMVPSPLPRRLLARTSRLRQLVLPAHPRCLPWHRAVRNLACHSIRRHRPAHPSRHQPRHLRHRPAGKRPVLRPSLRACASPENVVSLRCCSSCHFCSFWGVPVFSVRST